MFARFLSVHETARALAVVAAAFMIAGCSTSSAGAAHGAGRPASGSSSVTAPALSTPSATVSQAVAGALPAVTFTPHADDPVTMFVEIADTPDKQEYGLMNRTSMPDDRGMIFMFSREVDIPFWMKDTLIDLSIAFIDSSGVIVDMQEMQAMTLNNHVPAKPYQYAIEANAAWYSRHGIAAGDFADISQAVASSSVFGGASPTPSGRQ
jgi:uncharacterized membrane protein (UPF0127 family)